MKKAYFIYLHIGYWLILWLKEFLFGFQTYNLNDLSFATIVSTLSVKLIVLFFGMHFLRQFFSIGTKTGQDKKNYTLHSSTFYSVLPAGSHP